MADNYQVRKLICKSNKYCVTKEGHFEQPLLKAANRLHAELSWVSIPAEARHLSLLQKIQIGYGAHAVACSTGTGGSFLGW
jgi:hypothetical protein